MKIDVEVLEILSTAEVSGKTLRIVKKLERPMYMKVNKVLEACGGVWNRGSGAHIFDSDASERVDQIILTGQVDLPKDEFNYFPTPKRVVDLLLDMACIKPGMLVLEPEAGLGHIACEIAQTTNVDCYELQHEFCKKLIAKDLRLMGVYQGDFLSVEPVPKYDRVVMNPPFARQADIHHVMHAYKFLNTTGLLVAVMSAGVMFRDNRLTKEFRSLVFERGGNIEALPEQSFKESGTSVNTVVVNIPA